MRREAWREKVTLFFTYIVICGVFCFWLEFITALFCSPGKTFDYNEVFNNSSDMSGINGMAIDWSNVNPNPQERHMVEYVKQYPGYDLSPIFPLFMQLKRSSNDSDYNNPTLNNCILGFNKSAQADNWLNYQLTYDTGYHYENNQLISCPLPGKRNETGAPCFNWVKDFEESHLPVEGSKVYSFLKMIMA